MTIQTPILTEQDRRTKPRHIWFLNSASEANELALRLARTATGRRGGSGLSTTAGMGVIIPVIPEGRGRGRLASA